jgi:predicted thioesterase
VRPSQAHLLADTLRIALTDACRWAAQADPQAEELRDALSAAAEALGSSRQGGGTAASAPAEMTTGVTSKVGDRAEQIFTVAAADTAGALGHPDPSMAVLGSPRLGLWYEIVASDLLPHPSPDLTHVGVGILVHHLGRAEVGEKVRVLARLEEVRGRRALFSCQAWAGGRLVGLGAHHRVIVAGKNGPVGALASKRSCRSSCAP